MRSHTLPLFLLCCSLALFIFLVGSMGWVNFLTSSVQNTFFPVGNLFSYIAQPKKTNEFEKLQAENEKLVSQLAKMNQLQQDNTALRDQFDTTTISSKTLIPVTVVGMPNVIPNVTFPETLIIGKGAKESVKTGSVAIVKDEVIGTVIISSDHYADLQLISSKQSSFPVKSLQSGAIGVAKGQGNGEIIMDNVLLSDTLTLGDSVITLGNQDISGKGYPPGLIVGKIVSVEKNPSSLFQKARILPLVHFDHLSTIFIVQ